jgi:hypothetical protein
LPERHVARDHHHSDAAPASGPGYSQVNAVSVNYGAGAQYMFDGRNGVRFDYTRRDFQASGFDNPKDTNTYSVSFVRRF